MSRLFLRFFWLSVDASVAAFFSASSTSSAVERTPITGSARWLITHINRFSSTDSVMVISGISPASLFRQCITMGVSLEKESMDMNGREGVFFHTSEHTALASTMKKLFCGVNSV